MINLRKTLITASECLKSLGVSHALIGGFALAVYGVNRSTVDIDFLADGQKKDQIIAGLQKVGFKIIHQTNDVLQFEGLGQLDLILANRPMSQTMLKSAKTSTHLSIQVLAIEDIIGLKIQAYKNDSSRELQDKADIQALILKNPSVDWKKIKIYADLFNEWPFCKSLGAPHDP